MLCVVAGLPGAALFARYRFAGKRFLWAALLVPFVLPTVVVGVALLGVIGPAGASGVDLSGTIWAILIAHVFFNYAVVVRTVGGSWSTLDPRLEEAARTLGASPWRAFREVTWPRLRPAIAAASSIVFLFTFTSFGVVLILGGIRQRTLEVEIYDQTARFLHLDVAAGLALVQLVAVVVVLAWFSRTQQRRALVLDRRPASEVARRPVGVAGAVVRRRPTSPSWRSCSACRWRCWSASRSAHPTGGGWRTTRRSTPPGGARHRSCPRSTRSATPCCSPPAPTVDRRGARRLCGLGHRRLR